MHSALQLSPVGRCQPRWPSRPGTAAAHLACTGGRRRSRSGAVVSPQLPPQTKLAFHAFLEDGKAFYLILVLKLQQRFGPAGLPPGGCCFRSPPPPLRRTGAAAGFALGGPASQHCRRKPPCPACVLGVAMLGVPAAALPGAPRAACLGSRLVATPLRDLQPWRRSTCSRWAWRSRRRCRRRHDRWTAGPPFTAAWCAWETSPGAVPPGRLSAGLACCCPVVPCMRLPVPALPRRALCWVHEHLWRLVTSFSRCLRLVELAETLGRTACCGCLLRGNFPLSLVGAGCGSPPPSAGPLGRRSPGITATSMRQHCAEMLVNVAVSPAHAGRYQVNAQPAAERCWAECRQFYLLAARVLPGGGSAYNQLAVLCSYEADDLGAAFYYFRRVPADLPGGCLMHLQQAPFHPLRSQPAPIFRMNWMCLEMPRATPLPPPPHPPTHTHPPQPQPHPTGRWPRRLLLRWPVRTWWPILNRTRRPARGWRRQRRERALARAAHAPPARPSESCVSGAAWGASCLPLPLRALSAAGCTSLSSVGTHAACLLCMPSVPRMPLPQVHAPAGHAVHPRCAGRFPGPAGSCHGRWAACSGQFCVLCSAPRPHRPAAGCRSGHNWCSGPRPPSARAQ